MVPGINCRVSRLGFASFRRWHRIVLPRDGGISAAEKADLAQCRSVNVADRPGAWMPLLCFSHRLDRNGSVGPVLFTLNGQISGRRNMTHLTGRRAGHRRLVTSALALSGILLLHAYPALAADCGGGALSTSTGNL